MSRIVCKFYISVAVTAIALSLVSCAAKDPVPVSKNAIAFDTVVSISIYSADEGCDENAVLDEAVKMCDKYDALYSRTREGSDVFRINHARGESVNVDAETAYLLSEALSFCEETDGALDLTIAPLKELWQKEEVPSDQDISKALSHVNYKNVELDVENDKVKLNDPDAAIDLGFIAKGYIADQLKKFLVSNGVKSAVIDLGGNVLTIGTKPDGSPFNVGIKKPFGANGEVLTKVKATDDSVVTSGIYERYFTGSDGKIYHHILDPSTGFPSDNDLNSVTIVSDDSMTGDALSTACLILGYDKACDLLNTYPDVKAVFIDTDNKITEYPQSGK